MRKRDEYFTKINQEHIDDGEGNWLVSYADLMTLLFGFFAILLAFSNPDAAKIEKVKESTVNSVGGEYVKPFNELSTELMELFNQLKLSENVQIENLADGIRMTFSSKIIFRSAQSQLTADAREVIEKLATVLLKQGEQFLILVEGHTDDLPIHTREFRSNWDLSLARASEVVHLFESKGISRSILRPVGLADVEPKVATNEVTGQELAMAREENRRIVIRLVKRKH